MEPRSFVYKDVVRLLFDGGYSHREIAKATGCSTGTVSNIERRLRDRDVDADTTLGMSEQELRALLGESRGRKAGDGYMQPDYAAIQCQLDSNKDLDSDSDSDG